MPAPSAFHRELYKAYAHSHTGDIMGCVSSCPLDGVNKGFYKLSTICCCLA